MMSPNESVEEYKESFFLYDRRGDRKVDCSQIGEVLRACGTNPTENEITKITRDLDPTGTGVRRITFEEFFPIFQNLRDRQKKSKGKFALEVTFLVIVKSLRKNFFSHYLTTHYFPENRCSSN